MNNYIYRLEELSKNDIEKVGGKNASLGEMISHLRPLGVKVPGGFATTALAYRDFLKENNLNQQIYETLAQLDINNIQALTQVGAQIRRWILDAPFHTELTAAIDQAYQSLVLEYGSEVSWAVRSSATAEDLPDASFAGQQETFLNVSGLENIKTAIRKVFASLFTNRAIAYREHQGFPHELVALSAGIQKMVRSDKGCSGVMFSLDTESGFEDVVFITGSYGLGETVVQGAVNPDEFYVYKPTLAAERPAIIRRTLGSKAILMNYSEQNDEPVQIIDVPDQQRNHFCINDDQIHELARQAVIIEKHYACPMDIEWALDGLDKQIYIVQARPETVQSQSADVVENYILNEQSEVLIEGRAIGGRIGSGTARIITDLADMDKIKPGDVLITDMTDPDWEPVMKRAAAIVTNRGGRTCHAAIIARELGVPAVVGCSHATQAITDGQSVTVSCAQGDNGYVYQGLLDYEIQRQEFKEMPDIAVKIMMNVGNPDRAFDFCMIPNQGVGLARMEFIINNMIGIHPKALLDYDQLGDSLKKQIEPLIAAYASPREFFISKIVEGIATIAAAFSPEPVILRLSDFKSNEYAHLIGGKQYEPIEENPMLGFRGASRYISPEFQSCFEMECSAIKKVRNDMGFSNLEIMVPFVRTLEEAAKISELLTENGLARGTNGLRHIMMCEIPSNALLTEQFLEYFDGFSIGSNDMTQLVLGLDRDSSIIADSFDERNPAVKKILKMAIDSCNRQGKYIGICGQGPSDHPDFAQWLMKQGISSISLNPDTVIKTWLKLAS